MKIWLIKFGTLMALVFPRSLSYLIAGLLAHCAYFFLGKRKKALFTNLHHICRGKTERHTFLARKTLQNFARATVDFLSIPSMKRDELPGMVRDEGMENLDRAHAKGRGVIVVTAHLGNWELAGCYLASLSYSVTAVAESKGPGEKIFEFYLHYRQQMGMKIVALEEKGLVHRLLGVLDQKGIVVLVADRDLSESGIRVRFFDSTVFFPQGPAVLALRSGAPIICGYLLRSERGEKPYRAIVDPMIEFKRSGRLSEDVRSLTQMIADRIANQVMRFPDQWYVFQPPWEEHHAHPDGVR